MYVTPAISAVCSPGGVEPKVHMRRGSLSLDVGIPDSCAENPHHDLRRKSPSDGLRRRFSPESHPTSKSQHMETGRQPSPLPRLRSNSKTGSTVNNPNSWVNSNNSNRFEDGDSVSTGQEPQSQLQHLSQSLPMSSLSKSQLQLNQKTALAMTEQNAREKRVAATSTRPLPSPPDDGHEFIFAVPYSGLSAKMKVRANSIERNESLERDTYSSSNSSRSISFSDPQSRYPVASNLFRKSALPSHALSHDAPKSSFEGKDSFESLESVLPSNIQYLANRMNDLNMKKSLSFDLINEDSPHLTEMTSSSNRQRSTNRMSIDSINISTLMTPNLHVENSRGGTSDSLLILELETVHVLNERLTVTLETLQGKHEEEKDALLQQLCEVKCECEELSVENTALAAVLLGGARESLEKFCALSSSSNYDLQPSNEDSREINRELNSEFTHSSARKEAEHLDSVTGSGRKGRPSRAKKVSSATLALMELQELFELAVGNSKPQHELEVKFAADMRTAKRELADSQSCLLAAQQALKQLEAERLIYSLKREDETQSIGAVLEERDGLLRKAAREVTAVRSDCMEVGRKYEAVKTNLNEAKVEIALLKQEVIALHEDTIGGLEKQVIQLKNQLKESAAQCGELQKTLTSRSAVAAQGEKDAMLARAESLRVLADVKLMEDDVAVKTILIAELTAREGAAVLRKKAFEDEIDAVRQAAAAEKVHLLSLIRQTERSAEVQKEDLSLHCKIEEEKSSIEISRLQSQISDFKRSEERFRSEREEWETERSEVEKHKLLAVAAEKASADRAKSTIEEQQEALRSLEGEKAALMVSLALKDTHAANEKEAYLEDIRVREAARTAQLASDQASLVDRERAQTVETALRREAAFQLEKDSLLASVTEAQESLLRERAMHSDLIQAKERATAADRSALSEIHKDAEESFKSQRDVLNGHVAALKESGSGERAALISLLSSLREAADKEKDMMELLQVAENSHKKEHDAMLHRLTVSEGEISGAKSGMEESSRERDKAVKDREQLALELKALKGEEENLVNLLSDVKDAFKVEKEALVRDIERLVRENEAVMSEKDTLLRNMSALDKQVVVTKEEQHSIVKEKAVLLTRVIFLGEQRSDLLLKVEDMGKRTAEQAATIAGLNEEWGSLQGELSCVEKEKGCLEAALQSAVAAKEAAQSHSAEQIAALQTDLNGYIGDCDAMQAEHERAMSSLKSEMIEVELQYTHQEAGFLKEIQELREERDALSEALRRGTERRTDRDSPSPSPLPQDPSTNRHRYVEKNPSSAAPSGTARRTVSITLLPGDSDVSEPDSASSKIQGHEEENPRGPAGRDSHGSYLDGGHEGGYSEAIFFGHSSESKVMDMEATMREIEQRQHSYRQQQRAQLARM